MTCHVTWQDNPLRVTGDYGGGYNGGGGNGPRERLRREPQEILPTEKKGIPLGVPNIKGSINRGNKGTP